MNVRLVISVAALILPWQLRRLVLVYVLGYRIDRTARIGYSLVCPRELEMGPGSRIGHFTVCRTTVEFVRVGESAIIGHLNWISAVPLNVGPHFSQETQRRPELHVHEHAAITNRHYIDCTSIVTIGRFATIAGVHSVILTHSIDLHLCQQRSGPVTIGQYSFVGTASVILAGTALPDFSVLGANALLNKQYEDPFLLYAGTPARPVKQLSPDDRYFTRTQGFVD